MENKKILSKKMFTSKKTYCYNDIMWKKNGINHRKIFYGIIIFSLFTAGVFAQNLQDGNPPPPKNPVPKPDGPNFPNPPKRSDFYNFRGMRKNISDYPIEVMSATLIILQNGKDVRISDEEIDEEFDNEVDDEIELHIRFNQSINPRSFMPVNIFINRNNMFEGQILFNKNSDIVTLKFDNETGSGQIKSIEFRNIMSMDCRRTDSFVISNFAIRKKQK